jgi:rhodanese-related sulfurtransferase
MTTTLKFLLREIAELHNDRVVPVCLPVEAINLLTQVRKTIDDIDELAEGISNKGQLAQGIAAALKPHQAKAYVAELNAIRGSQHTISEFTPSIIDQKKYYVMLVAGHRRYIAVKRLVEQGVQNRHFDGQYRTVLYFGMSAHDALSLQFQENRHRQVPPHEEASAALDFYLWQRRRNPNLSRAQFGRSIGRSDSWVKSALRFCSLPESLQTLATPLKREGNGNGGGKLKHQIAVPYGLLVEVARLAEGLSEMGHPMDENTLMRLVITAVAKRTKVADFRKAISARLEHVRNGQGSLFGELPHEQRSVRRVVAPHAVQGLWGLLEYFKQLEELRKRGLLGKGNESYLGPETDPRVLEQFSSGSPLRLSAKTAAFLRDILPHLGEIASQEGGRHRKDLRQSEDGVAEAANLFRELEKVEAASKNTG